MRLMHGMGISLACVLVSTTPGAELASRPSPALVFHLPLETDVSPAVGPAAVAGAKAAFVRHEGRPAVRLEAAKGEHVVASWPAPKAISNAQGAVSFWVRVRQFTPAKGPGPALLRLVGTQGGQWAIHVKEFEYAAPKKKDQAAPPGEPRIDAPGGAARPDGQLSSGALSELGLTPQADEGPQKPVATLAVTAALKLFAEGMTRNVGAEAHLTAASGWHHVLWSWRSVHHDVYIDGKRVGGGNSVQSISRLAPLVPDDARLQLLAAGVDLADLRIHARYLDPENVPFLARATPSQRLADPAPLRVWADWGQFTGRTVVYADVAGLDRATCVKASCIDSATGKVLKTVTIDRLPERLGEIVAAVTEPECFPPGTYRFEAVALDASGHELGTARTEPWTAEKKDWPWLGFRGGLPDERKTKILPPYQPLTAQGSSLSTVSIQYTLDRTGLLRSAVAGGGEVLARPVALDVISGGHALRFDGGPGLKPIDNRQDVAQWSAESTSADGHRLLVSGHMEYDGLARFDLTLVPQKSLEAERIELVVPYRPDAARVAHAGLSWWFGAIERDPEGKWSSRRICWSGPSEKRGPRRPDVLFDSLDIMASHFPPPFRVPYAPYVHVGNFHRGLCWFVENDRNWTHDSPRVPAMEFVARGDETFLRLNLAARPVRLSEPWSIRFYMLANPFKPLPPDWRTWCVGEYSRTSSQVNRHTRHRFWWHWNEYARSFYPYPGGVSDKKYEDWVGAFKKDDGLYHTPFVNFGTPGGFPLWNQETMVLPFTWKLHNNRPHQDYMLYWADRCAREVGTRGVYIDEPYSEPFSYNVLADDAAYIRDDGTRALGFRYTSAREYVRRYKQLFTDLGIDYSLWLHTTNYKPLPLLTFADISMDGEHPQIWVPEFDNYHIFYNPTMSRGYLAGHNTGVVGAMMYHSYSNPKGADTFPRLYHKARTYLAVSLPYGVLPMEPTVAREVHRARNLLYAFGIFDEGLADLPMNELDRWLPGAKIQPPVRAISGIRHAERHRAMLLVSGLRGDARNRHEIEGGLASLDLGKPHHHAWNAENGASLAVDGKMRFELLRDDFAMILVEGRDAPQPSRPDGALLGASFDRGVEPDFGGGMRPTTIGQRGNRAEFTAGRSGQALKISAACPAVSYAVVPSWVSGTATLDLRVPTVMRRPLRLLELKHHLDLTLSLARQEGKLGLLLQSTEAATDPRKAADDTSVVAPREHFVPLPAAAQDAWRRVALAWQSGCYRIYVDGKPLKTLWEPCGPRLRDDEAMAAGVRLGDGTLASESDDDAAAVDSLLVYDWAFTADDAAQAASREALAPLARPAGRRPFSIVTRMKSLDNVDVSANFRDLADFENVSRVRFSLFDGARSAKPLATSQSLPWQGVAWGHLAAKSAPGIDDKLGRKGVLAEFGLDDREPLRRKWLVRVELIRIENKAETIVATQDAEAEVFVLDLDR